MSPLLLLLIGGGICLSYVFIFQPDLIYNHLFHWFVEEESEEDE